MSKAIDKLSGYCVVTGASSGIGLELTMLAARDGCDLLLIADRDLAEAENAARQAGAASVASLECDLGSPAGIEEAIGAMGGRIVDVLMANAGQGFNGLFLDQPWDQISHVIETNITGTLALIHKLGRDMRDRNQGRILVTGSIVGHMPGPFHLVYNSTKSFVDFFCVGLANELKESGVSVTCLLPGATETDFFERAGAEDTKVGKAPKADPAKVAKDGYDALLAGDTQVVSGFMNKVQTFFADILPDDVVAEMHRRMAQPEEQKASAH